MSNFSPVSIILNIFIFSIFIVLNVTEALFHSYISWTLFCIWQLWLDCLKISIWQQIITSYSIRKQYSLSSSTYMLNSIDQLPVLRLCHPLGILSLPSYWSVLFKIYCIYKSSVFSIHSVPIEHTQQLFQAHIVRSFLIVLRPYISLSFLIF